MHVGMCCCVKLKKNQLVVSEHILCVYPYLMLEYHVRSLPLIDGVTTLSNTLSILLAEKEEHSFLNIDLLANPHVSGKSEWR